MVLEKMPNGNSIYYASPYIVSVAYQYMEHYDLFTDVIFCINIDFISIKNIKKENVNKKIIYVNLEHKYPIDENGNLKYCNSYYTKIINDVAFNLVDEIWDFQIENYEYYKFYNLQNKFRFMPLRYTTWFEKYRTSQPIEFDIQLECVIDTNARVWAINQLTSEPTQIIEGVYYTYPRISINLTNTIDVDTKFKAKEKCKYGIDIPHYDTPCSNNTTRIYEYICMNKPVIVWDRDGITSREYFKDLCIYVNEFTTFNIKSILENVPRTDVAETFKQMTYFDESYNEYKNIIIKDYENRTGEKL